MGKQLNVFWFNEVPNFGDLLSPFIIENVLSTKVVWAEPSRTGKILGLGSIIDFASENDVIWGSGVKKPFDFNIQNVDVLAVRGPRTAKVLGINSPITYGDPGILVPLFIPAKTRNSKITIIPHYVDYAEIVNDYGNDPAFQIIDVCDLDFRKNCELISQSDLVISSSLHGIIISEAYGVPAHWLKVSDKIIGGSYKFNDYYESSNRAGKLNMYNNGLHKILDADLPPLPLHDTKALISKLENYFKSS